MENQFSHNAAHFSRKYVTVNGKKLAYIEQGQGPLVVLGHSFLWDANMWTPQILALRDHYRVIAPDLWAHGESDPIGVDAETYSIKSLADDYAQFLSAVADKPAAIIGLSVGGMWGAQLAIDHSELVSSLMIFDSYVVNEPADRKPFYFGLLDQMQKDQQFTPDFIKTLLPFFFGPETLEMGSPIVQQFSDCLLHRNGRQINAIVAIGRGIFDRPNILMELKRCRHLPIEIAVGEYDVPRPREEAQHMAVELECACHLIDNAGHISNLENPDAATQIIKQHLSHASGSA